MSKSLANPCVVCKTPANQLCSRCHVTSYCSKDHQKQHWKIHKENCRPYVIEESTTLGRYLVASKDIASGDVIMKDFPLVLGPRQITMPVCVSCSSNVNGSYSCSCCGWPLCSPECQNVTLHIPECHASLKRGKKVTITKYFQINEMYECITPLRCLWLQKTDPKKWSTLMEMECHIGNRVRSKATELDKSNVIDFIRGYLKYTDFDNNDIYKICGILEVNGFEIPAPNLVGLYGHACLLEHSCVANSTRTFDTQMNIIVRAALPIKKGDHITTSYTDPMWGTASRQMHLSTTKYFTCKCNRCIDQTELKTYFSSIKCPNCSHVLSPPLNKAEDWPCRECRTATPVAEVNKILKLWGEKLTNLRGNMLESEDFLKYSSDVLSENHHYRVDVKLALAQLIGKQSDSQLTGLSEFQLKKKESYCREVLKLVDIFSPGATRLSGLLKFELAMTMWELIRRTEKNQKFNKKTLPILKEIENKLKETHSILVLESPLQEEYQVGIQAKEIAGLVMKSIKKCKGKNK